jgi:tripartite-type tricarboxylate transporter receptor subunit TctC
MRAPGRHDIWLFAAIAAGAFLPVVEAPAQTYPAKPVRLLSGFSPGSSTDVLARTLATFLSDSLGQPVIVEVRGGAGGSIATESVARAAPDGYTLLMMAAGDAVRPALRAKLPYDLVRDLAPVSMIATGTAVLSIHPSMPARNVKELLALARAHPGKLSYGSSGVGSSSHLMGELLNLMAGVKTAHIPYKGSVESSIATASGQIEMSFPAVVALLPLLHAGKLRAIGVTRARRSLLLPDVPTLHESGLPGYDRQTWWGMAAPAGTPVDVVARLNSALGKGMSTAEMQALLVKQGIDPQPLAPDRFAAFIRNEIAQNIKLARLAGIQPE